MGTDKHGLYLYVACAASSFTNNNTNIHRQAKREHVNTQLLVPSLLLWFPQPIFDAQQCLRVNEGRQKQPNVKVLNTRVKERIITTHIVHFVAKSQIVTYNVLKIE